MDVCQLDQKALKGPHFNTLKSLSKIIYFSLFHFLLFNKINKKHLKVNWVAIRFWNFSFSFQHADSCILFFFILLFHYSNHSVKSSSMGSWCVSAKKKKKKKASVFKSFLQKQLIEYSDFGFWLQTKDVNMFILRVCWDVRENWSSTYSSQEKTYYFILSGFSFLFFSFYFFKFSWSIENQINK